MYLANGGHDHMVNMRPEVVIETVAAEPIPITLLKASKAVGAGVELFWDYDAACGKKSEEIKCLCHPGCKRMLVVYKTLSEYRHEQR